MTAPTTIWKAKLQGGRLTLLPTPAVARAKLFALQHTMQDAIAKGEMVEADCPLQHHFIDGVYVRTIFIPAGTTIVGKIHKHSHSNILSQGEVLVFTEGEGVQHLKGPLTMVSPAGCKRAVKALTDTTWTTIHATDETDLERIEDYVIAKDYADFEQFRLEATNMNYTKELQ